MDIHDQMFSEIFSEPKQKCAHGHLISNICIRNKCKASELFCSVKECLSCYATHSTCNRISVQLLLNLIKKYTRKPQSFLSELYNRQDRILAQLQEQRKVDSAKLLLQSFDESEEEMINELLIESKKNPKISKKVLQDLIQKLDQDDEEDPIPMKAEDKRQGKILFSFEKNMDQLMFSIKDLKKKSFYEFLKKQGKKDREYIKIEEPPAQGEKEEKVSSQTLKYREKIRTLEFRLKQEEQKNAKILHEFQRKQKDKQLQLTEFYQKKIRQLQKDMIRPPLQPKVMQVKQYNYNKAALKMKDILPAEKKTITHLVVRTKASTFHNKQPQECCELVYLVNYFSRIFYSTQRIALFQIVAVNIPSSREKMYSLTQKDNNFIDEDVAIFAKELSQFPQLQELTFYFNHDLYNHSTFNKLAAQINELKKLFKVNLNICDTFIKPQSNNWVSRLRQNIKVNILYVPRIQ